MTQLSVLDQVPIPRGSNAGAAIRTSIDLTRHVEELGFGAYWFAEHHLDRGRASSAPSILIALAIEATTRIKLGSAATVLPFHTSLDIAEQFGSLAAVAPGRVVLGLGRSKQGYGKSAPYRAYQEDLGIAVFGGESGYSATIAAKYGLPLYVNAHSVKNDIVGTVRRYREDFAPSKRLDSPYVGVSAHAIAAETTERGRELEETFLRTLASLRARGVYLPSEPPGEGFVEPDSQKFADSRALSYAGDAGFVVDKLRALADSVSADELLISTIVYAPEDRRTSYRLIAENWS